MLDSKLGGLGNPFTIGHVVKANGFVHVLDDTTLGIVLRTLDTIADFVRYLTKKEQFLQGSPVVWAAGEEELLAIYLARIGVDGQHDFILEGNFQAVGLDEGFWEQFCASPERKAQFEADKVSYSWDALIESFAQNSFALTQHYTTHPDLRDQGRLLRFLAREPRTRRRMLASLLHDMLGTTSDTERRARVVKPSYAGDPYFVFLLLPDRFAHSYEEYRDVRRKLLDAYCLVTKFLYPEALDIVGMATETGNVEHRSEDLAYYDARAWDAETEAEARSLRGDLGLLENLTDFQSVEHEYPPVVAQKPGPASAPPASPERPPLKAGRNERCPCGSGNK